MISTYIVNIANHIMGEDVTQLLHILLMQLILFNHMACQTIRKFVWLYGLLQWWTSLIFCQYLNSLSKQRLHYPWIFYMDESRSLLFCWDNSGEYMDHIWLLEISRLPTKIHQLKRLVSLKLTKNNWGGISMGQDSHYTNKIWAQIARNTHTRPQKFACVWLAW